MGLELARRQDFPYGMHKKRYISEFQPSCLDDIIQKTRLIIALGRWRAVTRQAVGSLIWCFQTIFDSCATVTALSTSEVESSSTLDGAESLAKVHNRLANNMQEEPMIIWYKPLCATVPSCVEEILQMVPLFSFSGAGFNSLTGSRSTQVAVIILCLDTPFKKLTQSQGCLLWGGASKITRVARSSIGADVIALRNALDVTVWYQSYLFEMSAGEFHRDLLSAPDTHFPLINHCLFGKSAAPLAEIREEYEPKTGRS